MNRILLISVAVLAVVAVFLFQMNKGLKTELKAANGEITTLNGKIKGYENAIQEYNDAQERAGERIEKVRTIVRTIKSDCDCWNTSVDDRVRDEIRKRKNHK